MTGDRPTSGEPPLRVAILAAARFPICEPFAGGLEAHTWQLAQGLGRRGHQVTIFAGEGSDPDLDVRTFAGRRPVLTASARADISTAPEDVLFDHHAYLTTMLELVADGGRSYDVVHNNSVHHLPLAMAPAVSTAQVTTLHTPPTPWMELAIAASPTPLPVRFCAVSHHTARSWQPTVADASVVANAVDLDRWRPGPGGTDAVWTGRIVPEKGLDLAVDAARRAGMALRIAGPIMDQRYWAEAIVPRLGPDVEWLGHLRQDALCRLVGHSAVAVVSPRWDEPFGLVALEALASGTPVAAIARGGLAEVLDATCSRTTDGNEPELLAAAMIDAADLPRSAARRRAEEVGSSERMVDEYEQLYRSCLVS